MGECSTLKSTRYRINILVQRLRLVTSSRYWQSNKLASIVGTLVLLLTVITGGYGAKRWYFTYKDHKVRAHRLLRRNSGLRGRDGSRTIFVPYGQSVSAKVVIYPTKPTTFDARE